MKRDVWIGVVLVLLAIALPVVASSGMSGVFWAFTMALLLLWWATVAARVRERAQAHSTVSPASD
ncbi:MAG: hypothetical protein KIT89_02030 [Microcella sp.]|uniref:hypothetical protein n=1 Tax=Microcella sp. TaxID=1913979 RepID=UPI0024C60D47|nr:hypothetical protein [Microcella sp.]UYN84031.1 MAG: hypothetical protein KIT89_02030 [Microcella sp.]